MKFSFYTGLFAAASMANKSLAANTQENNAVDSADVAFGDKSILMAANTDSLISDVLETAQLGSADEAEWGRRRKSAGKRIREAQERARKQREERLRKPRE